MSDYAALVHGECEPFGGWRRRDEEGCTDAPMLALLEDRVLSVSISEDRKAAEVREECDGWFGRSLTKAGLAALGAELIALSEGME